jgi:hypothetical protein
MNQKYHVQVSMNQAAIVKTGLAWKQGDFGFQVEIEVLDFDTSGTTPQIVFRKSAGAVESTDVSVVGNVYTYTFKGTELDVPGFGVCDLKLKNSTTQRISTASFMYECIADTLDGLNEHANSYSDTIGQIWQTLQDYSEDSEAWAVGTKNGVPVGGSDPRNANNSKWYAEQAHTDAENSEDIYTKFVNAMGIGTFSYLSNGHLYYDAAPVSSYTFSLSNGHLVLN